MLTARTFFSLSSCLPLFLLTVTPLALVGSCLPRPVGGLAHRNAHGVRIMGVLRSLQFLVYGVFARRQAHPPVEQEPATTPPASSAVLHPTAYKTKVCGHYPDGVTTIYCLNTSYLVTDSQLPACSTFSDVGQFGMKYFPNMS